MNILGDSGRSLFRGWGPRPEARFYLWCLARNTRVGLCRGFSRMHEEAGSPSQHSFGLYTLKCGQEAREFDSLTIQTKYLCRACNLPDL